MHLKHVANETKSELPGILASISALNAAESSLHHLEELDALDQNDCPGFVLPYGDSDAGKKGTRIRVLDMDTFDAALLVDPNYKVYTHLDIPKPVVESSGTSNKRMEDDFTSAESANDYAEESDFDLFCADSGKRDENRSLRAKIVHEDSDTIMKDAVDHDSVMPSDDKPNQEPKKEDIIRTEAGVHIESAHDNVTGTEDSSISAKTKDGNENKLKEDQSIEPENIDTSKRAEGGAIKESLKEDVFKPDPSNHFAVPSHTNPFLDVDSSDRDINSTREDFTIPSDGQDSTEPTTAPNQRLLKPVAVLNLASERSPGGGWHNGALAQEECLCYRSSLYLSLPRRYYPLPSLSAIYSPSVVLIRDAMSRGHALLTPYELPANLPVTSVISVAALRRPELSDDRKFYRNPGQRAETKRKIRVTLRVAALKGHTRIVLGAMGCGVFANPPKEVAECFLEVLRETEFQGGWWEEVVFAVLDNVKGPQGGKDGEGNYGVFYRVLDGQVV